MVAPRSSAMLSKAEQYRANAETCRGMAERLAREEDKAVWLDLAESWLLLIHPDEDASEDQSRLTKNSANPEDLQRHLFDPFVTTKPGGKGLGLALVAKIVGEHGGVIEFTSEPRRTSFSVRLPMARAAES